MMPSPNIEYRQEEHIIVPREVPIGKRLLIVGAANSGEYYNPVQVHTVEKAQEIFQSGPLIDRLKDAQTFQKGIDIYLMRIIPNDFLTVYEYLKPYPFDLVYFDDFQFGRSRENIDAFIDLAKEKEQQGELIHGFFDLPYFETLNELEEIFRLIESFTFEDVTDTYEEGKFLSVIVDQFKNQKAGAVYAGMVASLDPEVSPVNKTLNVELAQELTKEEILRLKEAGIVCFRESIKKGIVCASSSCAVRTPGSAHKHISNFRIAQYFIQELAAYLNDRIGQMNPFLQMNKIEDYINQLLDEYARLNRIREAEYALFVDKIKGELFVFLDLVPIFSVDHITVHSQVRIVK